MTSIHAEGWHAALTGLPVLECPYEGRDREAWMTGYVDALAERQKDATAPASSRDEERP